MQHRKHVETIVNTMEARDEVYNIHEALQKKKEMSSEKGRNQRLFCNTSWGHEAVSMNFQPRH